MLALLRLSELLRVRRPRNLRTLLGRLLKVGERAEGAIEEAAPSFVVVCERTVDPVGGSEIAGEVGWEDRGPFPGVGRRGVEGGESGGAGMAVPSVREKFMGERVRGVYLPVTMVAGCWDW